MTARRLLVTLSGHDRPGLTSALFDQLARHDVDVEDVEQVVIRGHLVLGVLLAVRPPTEAAERSVLDTARRAGEELGLSVETLPGDTSASASTAPRRTRSSVTVLGSPLRPAALSALAGRIADRGANIDRIVRLASYPVTVVELTVSGDDHRSLRAVLAKEAAAQQVDVAVQPMGLARRAKRLVVLDVDSTLVQGEVIELLAAHAGCAAEVARVTEAAMRGELDFADSLRARVSLLAGLSATTLDEVRRHVRLTPGARTLVRTLKRIGYDVGIVSGGFTQITDGLAAELGIAHAAANTLEVKDGRLTGGLVGPVVDRAGKAAALERFAREAGVPMAQTVAIGDGANDVDMLVRAGLGVAFNAKPVVREYADTSVSVPYLDTILYLLGIPRDEVEAADAEDGVGAWAQE